LVDTIYDHIDVQTILETASVAPVDHGLSMLLIDDPQIPADVRRRLTTKSAYASEYTAETTPRTFAAAYFGQKRVPANLMFGRWVSAAIAAQYTCGVSVVTPATYAAISDGEFAIAVTGILAGAATDVSGIDFSSVVTFADVLAEINTELHTVATNAYADYDAAIDSMGRVYFYNPDDPGAASETIVISAVSPTVGTDLTVATLLNSVGGQGNAGLDAETPVAAVDAISAVDDDWYMLMERDCSSAEQLTVAADIEGKRKKAVLVVSDTDAKVSSNETLGKQCYDLGYLNTMVVYHEDTALHNDAAIVGTNLPALEGSIDWAWQNLASTGASAASPGLSATDKSELEANNYTYFEAVKGNAFAPKALVSGGEEMRIMIGRDWFNDGITVGIFNAHLTNDYFAFDYETFNILQGIIQNFGDEAIRRGIGVNTAERPFTITMPDPDDISSTVRASHSLTLDNVFTLYLNSSVYDIAITGVWTI